MNQTPEINELVAALSKAQGKMMPAKFNRVNPHFKNRYADFTSCMDACRGPLSEHGLSIMQFCDEVGEKMRLVTMLAHTSGQWIKSYLPLNPKSASCQALGSDLTYMKRYGLSAMLGIVSDEDENLDDDGEASMERGKPTQKPYIQQMSAQQIAVIEGLSVQLKADIKEKVLSWIEKAYGTRTIKALAESEFTNVSLKFSNALKYQNDQKDNEVKHA